MVQKALDARPTFATVWIGNNDILRTGAQRLALDRDACPDSSSRTTRRRSTQLFGRRAAAEGRADRASYRCAGAPLMFQAGVLANPAALAARQPGRWPRRSLSIPTTCAGANAAALINFQYLAARSGRVPQRRRARSSARRFPAADRRIRAISSCSTRPSRRRWRRRSTATTPTSRRRRTASASRIYDPNPTLADAQGRRARFPLPEPGEHDSAIWAVLLAGRSAPNGGGAHPHRQRSDRGRSTRNTQRRSRPSREAPTLAVRRAGRPRLATVRPLSHATTGRKCRRAPHVTGSARSRLREMYTVAAQNVVIVQHND